MSAHPLDRLSAMLDGELTAEERAQVEAHLRACADCARHLEELPPNVTFLRHLGLYAYRVGSLRRLCGTQPHAWELAESLEQLRALAIGMQIAVGILDRPPPHGVDTEADLARAEAELARGDR